MRPEDLAQFARATLGAAAGVSLGGWLTVLADYWTFNSWFFRDDPNYFAQGLGWFLVGVLIMIVPISLATVGARHIAGSTCGMTAWAVAAVWIVWGLGIILSYAAGPQIPGFSVLVTGPALAFAFCAALWGASRLRAKRR